MDYGVIFKTAAINTMLGMGTVFLVLIFISFIISLFKFIAPKASQAALDVVLKKNVAEEEPEVEVSEDAPEDGVLIAVIMAALKASMEVDSINPAEYVVRSIRRR